MHGWLADRRVPELSILRDPNGLRTLETMRNAADKFDIHSAVVSTQDLFLDRTVFLARQAGIDAIGFAATPTRLRASAPIYEAAKTALAFVEVYVLGRLDHEQAPDVVAIAAGVR